MQRWERKTLELKDMFAEEPEPLDENDPEVQEDLFNSLLFMNATPEEVKDKKLSKLYKKWLKANPEGT